VWSALPGKLAPRSLARRLMLLRASAERSLVHWRWPLYLSSPSPFHHRAEVAGAMAVAFEEDTAEFHLATVLRQTGIRDARQPVLAR
jgi:hypothetical protein